MLNLILKLELKFETINLRPRTNVGMTVESKKPCVYTHAEFDTET
jgi:hypothetical protein